MLHCIGHITGLSLLEVLDGGIGGQMSSIQHRGGGSRTEVRPGNHSFCLVCPTLACLAPLWASPSWEGWAFPPSTTSLPFCSLFLLRLAGSGRRGWVGGGVVSLVWATFLGEFPSGWDFSSSCRVDLGLHWIPILFGMEVTPWW